MSDARAGPAGSPPRRVTRRGSKRALEFVQGARDVSPVRQPPAAPPSHSAAGSLQGAASAVPDAAAIMATLTSIQATLSGLDGRVSAMEGAARAPGSPVRDLGLPPPSIPAAAPAPPSASSSAAAPGVFPSTSAGGGGSAVTPVFSLETAVPAPATGGPFVSPAAAVAPSLRSAILQGKDVNLVKILIGASESFSRLVDTDDVAVLVKANDARLSRSLSMSDFCIAFGVYRDVMCEVYPGRRVELDTYLSIIADLEKMYGTPAFYEYHKAFSAKAALYIAKFNQRLDWSVLDLQLISRLFTGRPARSCAACGDTGHSTGLCPSKARPASLRGSASSSSPPVEVNPRRRSPICFNFNSSTCSYIKCRFLHVCSHCGDAHPAMACPRRTAGAGSGRQPPSTSRT